MQLSFFYIFLFMSYYFLNINFHLLCKCDSCWVVVQEGPFIFSSQIASVMTGKAITIELTIEKRHANPRKKFLHFTDVIFLDKPEFHSWVKLNYNNFSSMALKMVYQHMLLCAFLFLSRGFSAEGLRLWTLRSLWGQKWIQILLLPIYSLCNFKRVN